MLERLKTSLNKRARKSTPGILVVPAAADSDIAVRGLVAR